MSRFAGRASGVDVTPPLVAPQAVQRAAVRPARCAPAGYDHVAMAPASLGQLSSATDPVRRTPATRLVFTARAHRNSFGVVGSTLLTTGYRADVEATLQFSVSRPQPLSSPRHLAGFALTRVISRRPPFCCSTCTRLSGAKSSTRNRRSSCRRAQWPLWAAPCTFLASSPHRVRPSALRGHGSIPAHFRRHANRRIHGSLPLLPAVDHGGHTHACGGRAVGARLRHRQRSSLRNHAGGVPLPHARRTRGV